MTDDRPFDVSFRTQQIILLAAETGSFRKTAKALGLDAAVVVRSIKRLEKELGAKIFERSRNAFAVTRAGSYFIREIQEAVTYTERACDLARYHASLESGPFRLGYSAYIHSRLIPVLEALHRSGISPSFGAREASFLTQNGITLACSTTPQLINQVLRGQLHAAVGVQPIDDQELWLKPLMKESFCLCVSKNHRLAKQPSILARELDGEVTFFLPRMIHPGLYDRTVEYIASTGAKPAFREVLSLAHAMELVARNYGVALLPHSASHVSHMGVLFKPITDKLLYIETALFLRRDQRSERAQWMIDALLSRLKSEARLP